MLEDKTYHEGPRLILDATKELPEEAYGEEGNEERVGAHVRQVAIQSSFDRTWWEVADHLSDVQAAFGI